MNLTINETYSQKDIQKLLNITIMRGMNYKIESNRLILVRNHIKSIYDDKQEGNILFYTGEGRSGDQTLTGMNKRLLDSLQNKTEVHLFEVFTVKEYTYKGLVTLRNPPIVETQTDENDENRLVYVFPLQLNLNASINSKKELEKIDIINNKKIKSLTSDELEKRTKQTQKKKPGYTYSKIRIYQRSPYVVETVNRRANGICELCEKDAPFKNSKGKPYLEVHHIIQLSKGGEDTVDNAVALCPNCHRKMHSIFLEKDILKLQKKVSKNES